MRNTDKKYDEDWHSLFYYDETSPSCLRWKEDRYRGRKGSVLFIRAGDIVGSLNKRSGYWHVHTFGKMYNAHNIVWKMFGSVQGDLDIDHRDRDKANTRIHNLRLGTHTDNMRNRSLSKTNKSGESGIHRREIKSRHDNGRFNTYWIAHWTIDSGPKQKAFSIEKFGEEEAKSLAISYRRAMIEQRETRKAHHAQIGIQHHPLAEDIQRSLQD